LIGSPAKSTISIVGKVRKDTFNGGYYLEWIAIQP
jgi:hypothetical protein